MDELRARAYLDLLLGKDSRPAGGPAARPPRAPAPRAGFAGRVTLTAPLATLTRLAGRPGELAGLGPGRPLAGPRPGRRRRAQPEDDLVPDRHRRARATPSPTAAPGPNPRATGNAPAPARQTGRVRVHRPAGTGRPADGPGGCAPPDPDPT